MNQNDIRMLIEKLEQWVYFFCCMMWGTRVHWRIFSSILMKISVIFRCILDESQSCQAELRATYAQALKAEQLVLRDLCRPGPFQDGELSTCPHSLSIKFPSLQLFAEWKNCFIFHFKLPLSRYCYDFRIPPRSYVCFINLLSAQWWPLSETLCETGRGSFRS